MFFSTQTNSENIEKEQQMELSIQAKDNKFESKTTSTRKKSPSRIESFLEEPQEEEKMSFPLIIEEIFKLPPANKFPRRSVSDSSFQPQRPKSSIEEDLKKEESLFHCHNPRSFQVQ